MDNATLKAVADAIVKEVQAEVRKLREEYRDLETSVNEFRYVGVWGPGRYQRNNSVTHRGQIYIARHLTEQKPGDGADWELALPRGEP